MKIRPGFLRILGAVMAIAAAYGYFLLFAEFAFLRMAEPIFGRELALRPILALLGAGGVVGSLLAAWRFDIRKFRGSLEGGFIACAMAAGITLISGRSGFWLAAVGVGLSLGWTTVVLSSGLRAVVGSVRLGVWCGLGTGLAYALSNLPAVFKATPPLQTATAMGLALAGGFGAGLMEPAEVNAAEAPDHGRLGLLRWGVIFLALVWLDSAGFYLLQRTDMMGQPAWGGTAALYGNAAIHLLGALLAGWALDARRIGAAAFLALLMLLGADALLRSGLGALAMARGLYTTGVSAYSVAMVYYPALGARPWRVAILFAFAGWLGSALGIGMVQDLHVLPWWFMALAGTVVIVALVIRPPHLPKGAFLFIFALAAVGGRPSVLRADATDEVIVARGREVYIAEGCINCHSQYIRPGVIQDVEWWGPSRSLTERLAGTPPLLGLRRQGPDLMNVGNRRWPEWQRLHLTAPRTISPGSKMPGYAYLFAPGDQRGPALLSYLSSLGVETIPDRQKQIAIWVPAAEATAKPYVEREARRDFAQYCAACHGADGRGGGSVARMLSVKPPDFSSKTWRHLPPDQIDRTILVERMIKFGLLGTTMAGREYLADDTIVELARLVEAMHH